MQNEQYLLMRREALGIYGGECECCGEDRWTFLEFDHINGDGKAYGGHRSGRLLIWWLRKHGWPDGVVQILCANCHKEKTEHGRCLCTQ